MDQMNLKKLAEQLNLSISTVSKAFRNSYDINPQTKDRILAVARELNYQPNPLASSLRTQKSKTIAVILPEIANNFFTLAINGIESVAQEQGYHVLIYLTHEDQSKEVAFTRLLQSGRVDGVLISLSEGNDFSHLRQLREKGMPIVFFDRIFEDSPTTKVSTNNFESGYKATTHLIDQGCKKIAHLYVSSSLSIANQRREGYLQALKDHGLRASKKIMLACTNNNESNLRLITNMIKNEKPDGIFSSFERLALLAYDACHALKRRIPQDVKVISFSNLDTAHLLNPSLTTITQPAFEIGQKAASVLFRALGKNNYTIPNEQIAIDSKLIKRNSTKK